MAHLSGNSRVTPISNTPFLLDDFLRPFWKCLRYIGFQHGFLGPVEERRVFYILRCVSTTLIILSVCNLEIFQLVGLLRNIPSKQTKDAVVQYGILSSLMMMSLVFSLHLYWRHDNLVEFLKEWKRVETSFDLCSNRRRKEYLVVFIRFLCMSNLVIFPILYFCILTQPNLPIFYTSIEVLREIFGLHFLSFYDAICHYFSAMMMIFSDFIPGLIFYHAGCMIEDLKLELDETSPYYINSAIPVNEKPCRFLWKKYESIQKLVDSANQLFGLIMIVNQFCFICSTCLSIYRLTEEPIDSIDVSIFAANVISAIAKTLLLNWLYSHLPLSCGELKKSVSALLSEKWHLMPQDHQNYLNCFYNRLNGGELAACPLNLFTIDRSNLLSLLTLHISYTIVLIQS